MQATSRVALAMVIGGIVVWLVLILVGTHVSSDGAYWDYLVFGRDPSRLFMLFVAWTWTNTCMACCICSTVGEALRAYNATTRVTVEWIPGITRGFFIYLCLLTGQLIIAGGVAPAAVPLVDWDSAGRGSKYPLTQSFGDGSVLAVPPSNYFRVVSAGSLASFIVGYRPMAFLALVAKLSAQLSPEKTARAANDQREDNKLE